MNRLVRIACIVISIFGIRILTGKINCGNLKAGSWSSNFNIGIIYRE